MLKFTIISIFVVLISIPAQSQEFFLGVKAGIQGYTMAFGDSDLKDTYSKALKGGYSGGILINFPLPIDFSLASELNYSVKGRKIRFNNDEWTNNAKYTFIEVPVLLRKFFDVNGLSYKAKWFLNMGPHFSYWSGGKGRIETNGPGLDYSLEFTDDAAFDLTTMYLTDVNRYIFGMDLGIGFMAYILENQRFFVEARFTYGHTYLGQADSANLYILGFEDDLRNNYRTLNLSFGYAIHLDVRDTRKGKSTAKNRKMR